MLGPGNEKDNAATEAADIFARLGAKPFMERLSRALDPDQKAS